MANQIGAIIKQLRSARHLTQEELAEILHTTTQTVAAWESYEAFPDLEQIPKLASFFHVPISRLFDWDHAPTDLSARVPARPKQPQSLGSLESGQRLSQAEIRLLFQDVSEKRARGKRVLIVDDAGFMKLMLTRILEKHGFSIAGVADTGEEAVKLVDSIECDIILMDLVMPGMDGFEASQQILKHHPEVCIVICSAASYAQCVAKAMTCGASRFLVKPFVPETLLNTIRELLS